jgi:hypothetical protein
VQPSLEWLAQARHVLGRHVDDLRESLAVLGERLRDAVGHAVGGTVAGAVREAVRALLSAPGAIPLRVAGPGASSGWSSPYRERSPYADEESVWPSEWPDHDRYEEERAVPMAPPAGSGPLRWARALAVGFQAVAWWLRRKTQNPATWATLGLGVLVALAAYWAGAALSSTVLSLLALAETPHATTSGWSSLR